MRALFLLLLLVLSGWVRCQEGTLDTASISSEDALVLKNLKNKVAQYINTQPDSAFYFSRKMKALALERKYPKGVSEAYYLIGQCFKRIQKTDSAIHYFKTSLAHSQNIHDSHGEARAYNSLCRTYYLTGDMDASENEPQDSITPEVVAKGKGKDGDAGKDAKTGASMTGAAFLGPGPVLGTRIATDMSKSGQRAKEGKSEEGSLKEPEKNLSGEQAMEFFQPYPWSII